MLSMKKLTFVAEDWQMPWYHLSALANEKDRKNKYTAKYL